ncbi:hypothetical protein D3C76_1097590 [compost metagenome]
MVGSDLEVIAVDHHLQRRVVVEDDGRPGVPEQTRLHGARLDHATGAGQVALEHRQGALGINWVVQRTDHIVVVHLGLGDVLPEGTTIDGHLVERQVLADHPHQRRQAARVEEVLHQVLAATGPHVGDHRHIAADRIEVVEGQVMPCPARHGNQVDHRIGRAPHGHGHGDRVVVGAAGLHPGRHQVLPDHLHRTAPGFGAHADMVDVRRWN